MMAATITQEHHISIDGKPYVVFAEIKNAAPVERWRLATVNGGDWTVVASSHASRKEAYDALYLLALAQTRRAV